MLIQAKCPHCGKYIEITVAAEIAPEARKRYAKVKGSRSSGTQYGSLVERHEDGTVSFHHE